MVFKSYHIVVANNMVQDMQSITLPEPASQSTTDSLDIGSKLVVESKTRMDTRNTRTIENRLKLRLCIVFMYVMEYHRIIWR